MVGVTRRVRRGMRGVRRLRMVRLPRRTRVRLVEPGDPLLASRIGIPLVGIVHAGVGGHGEGAAEDCDETAGQHRGRREQDVLERRPSAVQPFKYAPSGRHRLRPQLISRLRRPIHRYSWRRLRNCRRHVAIRWRRQRPGQPAWECGCDTQPSNCLRYTVIASSHSKACSRQSSLRSQSDFR